MVIFDCRLFTVVRMNAFSRYYVITVFLPVTSSESAEAAQKYAVRHGIAATIATPPKPFALPL